MEPDGPSTVVSTPEGEHVTVTLPSAAQLAETFDDALEAAELADAQHAAQGSVSVRPQAPAAVRPKPPVRPQAPAATARPEQSKAAKLAPGVAQNIRTKKYNYSHQALADFQRAAGIAPDGIYGPASERELSKYTNAPKALFRGASSARAN
jgi:peptidoglycan hydrolase-like protein with peptidoglycan-binding domain